MHAHLAEVSAEACFHVSAGGRIKWLAGRTQHVMDDGWYCGFLGYCAPCGTRLQSTISQVALQKRHRTADMLSSRQARCRLLDRLSCLGRGLFPGGLLYSSWCKHRTPLRSWNG